MQDAVWQRFNLYKQAILKAVIAEVNVTQGIPVQIMEIVLTSPMRGFLKCSEPRRIYSLPFAVAFRENDLFWQHSRGSHWYLINLTEYDIDAQQAKRALMHLHDWKSQAPWLIRQSQILLNNHPDIQPRGDAEFGIGDRSLLQIAKKQMYWLPPEEIRLHPLKQALSTKIKLGASNYAAIAYALEFFFPDADLLKCGQSDIKKMITGLDNFAGSTGLLNNKTLDAVIYTWIEIRGNGFEDNAWDAWV